MGRSRRHSTARRSRAAVSSRPRSRASGSLSGSSEGAAAAGDGASMLHLVTAAVASGGTAIAFLCYFFLLGGPAVEPTPVAPLRPSAEVLDGASTGSPVYVLAPQDEEDDRNAPPLREATGNR